MEKLRRLKYKKVVKKNEKIKIKTLAEHEMEPGVRRDPKTGIIYPRLIHANFCMIVKVEVRIYQNVFNNANCQILRGKFHVIWYNNILENQYHI